MPKATLSEPLARAKRAIKSPVTKIRIGARLSQTKFAALMGISVRTLQDWEQGRRSPSGAAKTLLRVAEKHPDVLREAVKNDRTIF
ncbi:MAG: transcriptional regulator [Gammaproteobacteria bacterium HGW-Gammaproteobacteria-3]|nr:MAG: transcriptional regulator [Gammaproteobacteria bacterium HGW-Gammaproteobacteria-3]